MGSYSRQVVVTVNGPGEISAWLYPFASRLKSMAPDVKLTAALLPCVFATGSEQEVLQSLDCVDAISPKQETRKSIYSGRKSAVLRGDLPGCLLHLGGEPLLSVLLAKRLHYPALAYIESPISWQSRFDRVFYTDEEASPAIGKETQPRILGNLFVDAARMRCPNRRTEPRSPLTVGILPGSRYYMVKHMLPFFVKAAGMASASLPETRWLIAKADYISLETVKTVAMEEEGRLIEAENSRWQPGEGYGTLISEKGLHFQLATNAQVMEQADLVLTIPGTNTAELTALGVPMIVVIPTYYAETHPLPGVLGHVGRIPVLGKYIKRGCALAYLKHKRFLAHPNRRKMREVVPEIAGRVTTEQIARILCETLEQRSAAMERELLGMLGPPGASERLVREVLAAIPAPLATAS